MSEYSYTAVTDPNVIAMRIVEAARLLGQHGGAKGGHARAAILTAEQRHDIAQRAAKRRWDTQGPKLPNRKRMKAAVHLTPERETKLNAFFLRKQG